MTTADSIIQNVVMAGPLDPIQSKVSHTSTDNLSLDSNDTVSDKPLKANLSHAMNKLHLSHAMNKVNPSSPTLSPSSPSIFSNPHAGQPIEPREDEPDYLKLILTAQVYDVALETPLQKAENLSARLNNTILLKREDLQPVFSFKLRGAFNRMCQLSEQERRRGVIACSAGNHAQGVALAAKRMGIHATIVMPLATPPIKWRNVKRLGATVLLHGIDFDEAKQECARLSVEKGLANIPPYDDPYIIAGQGTVGVEIFRQTDYTKIDAVFVCIGGGGLAAGIASYIKRLHPAIKIIGVETFDANSMTESLLAGRPVTLPHVGLFADGAAVRVVGNETFRLCKSLIDEMVLVSTDEICAAIKDTFEDTRSIVEPAGALGIAGAKKYIQERNLCGGTFVAVTSGANMNFDRLRFVAERADLGENREALMSVLMPDRPGMFTKFYQCVHPRVVTELSYRYGTDEAHVIVSFLVNDRESDLAAINANFDAAGMHGMDVSYNELAKAHARYLVGGRKNVPDERLFRFAFPERPGALAHFLSCLKDPRWNVTLFHYRNYGGDVAKVMIGIRVPKETMSEFELFLGELGYPYVEETDNEVYKTYLK